MAPGDSTQPPRRRRADAERNRQRLLESARELFSTNRQTTSMDDIARRADVGIGTLYRHFPTKEALIAAVSEQRFAGILDYARTVARKSSDPVEALRLLLLHIGEVESRDHAFAIVVENTLGAEGVPLGWQRELEDALVEMVRDGQITGGLRADLIGTDILAATCGLAAIVHRGTGDWRRFIDIVLNGLRHR